MTTDTTTGLMTRWVDDLVPTQMREDGQQLLLELDAVRVSMVPLLERCRRFLEVDDALFRDAMSALHSAAGGGADATEATHEISNGLGAIISILSHAGEITCALDEMGIDPADLKPLELGPDGWIPVGGA